MSPDQLWDVAQAASVMRETARRLREEADALDDQAAQLELNADAKAEGRS